MWLMNIILVVFLKFKTSLHKQEAVKTTDNNYTKIKYTILIMMNDIRIGNNDTNNCGNCTKCFTTLMKDGREQTQVWSSL